MEHIVLEVDGALARAWRNTTPDVRHDFESKISTLLKGLKESEFDQLLNRSRKSCRR